MNSSISGHLETIRSLLLIPELCITNGIIVHCCPVCISPFCPDQNFKIMSIIVRIMSIIVSSQLFGLTPIHVVCIPGYPEA